MDARVALAMVAVIRSVVASEESPVAFLLSPEEVPAARFRALSGDDNTLGGQSALFSLAWLVNGRIGLPYVRNSTSVPLWALVHDILNRSGRPGGADRLGADDAAYREARALLYVDDGTAQARPSEAHLAYQRMKDEWYRRRNDLASRTFEQTLLPPGDPQRPLQDEAVARLASELDDLERRWEEEGFRSKIEGAQETIDAIAARAPRRQWRRWQDMLAPFVERGDDLGSQTDVLTRSRFAATAIVPARIEQSALAWTRIAIGGADIDRLVAALPAELKAPLNPGDDALNLDSLEFEWTTAGIVRPWLDRTLFSSRTWRFDDAARMLSDGAAEPEGECPYIATGLVLMRNPKATFRAPAPAAPAGPQAPLSLLTNMFTVMTPPPPPPPPRIRPAATVVRDHRTRSGRPGGLRAAPAAAAARPALAMFAMHGFHRQAVATPAPAPAPAPAPVEAPAAAPVAAQPAAPDSIMIFGLICNAVPRCPNPDAEFFRQR